VKHILIAAILVTLLCGSAFAHGSKDVCDGPMAAIFNKCVDHPTPDKTEVPVGVGLDLIILESDVEDITYKITAEYRYDVRNSEQSIFGVLTLKLADIINKFKKDE